MGSNIFYNLCVEDFTVLRCVKVSEKMAPGFGVHETLNPKPGFRFDGLVFAGLRRLGFRV